VRDGINSLTRYYKNNFTDGFRQVSRFWSCTLVIVVVELTWLGTKWIQSCIRNFNVWLTSSFKYQLDAQFLYSYFIIHLLHPCTCFEQQHAHHQEVKLY
jgi:hypothetical protein